MNARGHIRRIAASCMVMAVLLGSSASADSVTVTADRLNLRSAADLSSKVALVVDQGNKLSFVSENGDWIEVKSGSKSGFVKKEYVSVNSSAVEDDIRANTTSFPEQQSARALERVNMRSLPMTTAGIVKVVPKGCDVTLLGQCGAWYSVKYGGKSGYILSDYLVITGSADSSASSGTTGDDSAISDYKDEKQGVVTERVNVRKSPSTTARIAKVVDRGAKVSVLGENSGWYHVNAGGTKGYIAKAYVTVGMTTYDSAREGKTKKEVNLRASASTASKVLKIIRQGTEVSVLGETDGWYQVRYEDTQGYISAQYLSVVNADEESDVSNYPAAKSGVTTDRVNVRAQASTSSKIVKVLNSNASISVLGESGSFYYVVASGKAGYIAKQYVKLVESAPTTPDETPEPEVDPTTPPSSDNGSTEGETLYSAAKTGYTTVTVNMRKTPEGDILHTLPANTQVSRIGELGAWYKVVYGGSIGYISMEYISDEPDVQVPENPPTSGSGTTMYVTAGSLNLRQGPGKNYAIVGVLTFGEEVTSYSVTDGWHYVQAGDKLGYVSEAYLSATEPDSVPSNPEGSQPSNGKVVMIDWWTGGIQDIFARGVVATVTDVDTGISWQVKRSGGTNHADVQPLTAADTAKMKQAYGGKWSWDRHAIWVTINGVRYAASMNGMPHGTGSITTNNFDGHHCIHFLNSRTHTGNRLDSAHQAAVKKAYNAGQ